MHDKFAGMLCTTHSTHRIWIQSDRRYSRVGEALLIVSVTKISVNVTEICGIAAPGIFYVSTYYNFNSLFKQL